jgi:hypothetical protein
MVNTTPAIGRIAIVQVNSTTVAYAQGYNIKESAKAVKEYTLATSGGDWPSVGFSGNKDAKIDIDALYVDNTYVSLLEAGTQINIVCGPAGSSGGNPKDTYPCVLTDVSISVKHDNITVMKISAEIVAAPTHGTW